VLELPQRHENSDQGYTLIHPDDLEHHRALVTEAIATGGSYVSVYRHPRNDRVIWLEEHGRAVVDQAGKTIRLVGVTQNITERKQAEEALRESDARFRSVLDSSRDVIYRFNAQTGRFEYISPSAATVVGFCAEELMAQDSEAALAMVHPDDRPVLQAAIARLHETGSAEAEYRQLTRSGEYRWLSNAMSLTTDEAGQPLYRNGNIRDITERWRADEALRESDRRFRSLFENSTDAVFLTATDGRVFAANPAACAMLGMSEREVCEKGRAGLIAPDDPRVGSAVEERISEGRVHAEFTFVRKDGSRFEGDVTSMVLDEAGDAFVVVRDITERKRAEAALRESEARFRTLFDTMSEGFTIDEIVCDESGKPCDLRYLELNPAFERHTGLKRADIVGRTMLELWPKAEPVWLEIYGTVALAGTPAHFEAQFGPLNRWFEISAYQTLPGRFAAVFFDITERKQAEEALRQRESEQRRQHEFLATLLDNAPYGISVHEGRDFLYELVNPAYQAMVGSDIQLVGRPYRDVFPEAAAAGAEAKFQQVIETGEPWIVDHFRAPVPGKPNAIWAGQVVRVPAAAGDEPLILAIVWDVSEQAATEEALRESERRFRALVTASSEAVYRMSPDWSEMRHLVGRGFIADMDAPSHNWLQKYIHPDDQPRVVAAINEAIGSKGVFELEHRVLRVDGSLGWTFSRAVPLQDANGEIVEWFGAASDITERKQAEEARAQTNAQLEGILGSIPEPVMVTDANGHLVRSNHVFERRHLITAPGALGEYYPVVDAFTEDGHPVPPGMWPLSRAIKGERISGLTLRLSFRNGGPPRFYRYSANPVYDRNGRVTHAVVVFFDVTENRIAEETLRNSRMQLQDIIDGSPGIVFVKDLEGRFITVNQTFERLLGVARAELRGKTDYDLITRERAEDYREQDRRVAETGEPIQIEEVADLADGRQHVFLANKFPLRDASGKIYAVCAISTDITERKQAEEALRENRAKLAERAAQLERTTAELEARNREVERMSRMKTSFLTRISHELRTPLNAVVGYSDLLNEQSAGPLPPPYPRFVANIREGASYMLAMVNDVLDISRIEAGRLELNPEAFPLAAAVEDVLLAITPLANIKNIAIDNQVPPGASVRADRTRIKQVLYNLLSNAVKFTPENGRVWIAEASREDAAGFCVGDTGIGIPESELGAVFDEFYRVGGASSAAGGTGLGLAITRRLVELHGGTIRVESAVGQGSRFIVSLGPHSAEHHSAVGVMTPDSP